MDRPQDTRDARPFLDPAALTRLGNLKIRARHVVEGVLTGLHRSPHKGSSVEFAEYKEYAPGDEIRLIDWKAFAKSDKYYVKQFEEETNLRAYILLDASGSMTFTSHEVSKLAYAQTLAASLAYLLIRQGDAAGLMLFDERPGVYLPPSGRSNHLDDILRILEKIEAAGRPTNTVAALNAVAERVRRRSLIILISDMLETAEEVGHLLRVLRSRKMDVVLFHVVDPHEITLPYEGLTLFEGLEGEGDVLVEPDDIRDGYVALMKEHFDTLERVAREAHMDYHRVLTTEPYEDALLALLASRRRSRKGR